MFKFSMNNVNCHYGGIFVFRAMLKVVAGGPAWSTAGNSRLPFDSLDEYGRQYAFDTLMKLVHTILGTVNSHSCRVHV